MSKLDELIQELCPDGVEFKTLGEISQIIRGASPRPIKKFLTTSETGVNWIKIGDVRPGEKYINEAKEHITPSGAEKSRFVKKGDFILSNSMSFGRPYILNIDGCIHDGWLSISNFERSVEADYLYYVLVSSSIQDEMAKRASFGGAVQNLNADIVKCISIPVPPMEVQSEIVRILDNFTDLKAELTAELTARKQQYEYYRNKLLTFNPFDKASAVTWRMLGDVCKFVRGPFGGSLKKDCFVQNGIAVYEQQHAIHKQFNFRYFITDEKYNELKRFEVFPGELIMSCSGTMGEIAIIPNDAPKGIINQALLKITVGPELNNKFLKYYFEAVISKQFNETARGGAIKNVASVGELKKVKIPVPSLDTQRHLVHELDYFELLCSDLISGLPAEINARQKQYEFYRDRLLTFIEKTA